jgi:hypothetical protein
LEVQPRTRSDDWRKVIERKLCLDRVAESLLTAVLGESGIPKQQMRRNVRQHIVAYEALVRNAVAADAQEEAIEEFRARFRACLHHEASNANDKTAKFLGVVLKIFSEDRPEKFGGEGFMTGVSR